METQATTDELAYADVNAVLMGYTECALWSSSDYAPGADPETDTMVNLDDWHGDLTPETLASFEADVRDFLAIDEVRALIQQTGMDWEQVGHDFWLTRNRHGAGFWDRGLGAAGTRLTELAKEYGSCDLYIGDDERIYAS